MVKNITLIKKHKRVDSIPDHIKLIEGCISGDIRSQLRFYDLHCKRVYSSAYRILNDEYSAEHITQETFLTAFEKMNEVKETKKIASWLCRIATNKSLNELRKNKISWIKLNENDGVENEDENQPYYNGINIETVYKCIQQLADGYKLILNLYLIEGYSHAEIAHELQIEVSTSRSQCSRAKNKLRKLIEIKHGEVER